MSTHKLQSHFRNTLLAGAFAVVPIAVTVFLIYKVDEWTRGISLYLFGRAIPFLGALIAVVAVYLVGLVVTVSVGKFILRGVDSILSRIPLLKTIYTAWKQISFTPGGGEGMFARVVLVPDETGQMRALGFTSGQCIENQPDSLCVFVPNAPNPIQGKLYVVPRLRVQFLSMSAEEAFKILLSTGNYFPPIETVTS